MLKSRRGLFDNLDRVKTLLFTALHMILACKACVIIFHLYSYTLQEKAASIPTSLKMLIFVSIRLTDWLTGQTDSAITLPLTVHVCTRDQESSLGTSVNSFYTGGFLHAHDIRTLANSISTLEEQVALVQKLKVRWLCSQLTGQQPWWNVALMVKWYLLGMLGNAYAGCWDSQEYVWWYRIFVPCLGLSRA